MIKKLESLEKYVITPNVRFYGGYVYNGEDIELCNDKDEEEEGYKIHIQDKIIDGHLIKQVEQEYTMSNGKKVKQKEYQDIELEENQLLIYVEGQGFVISEYKMLTIDEAIEKYKLLKSPEGE
jgi:hypothetical protein